MQSPSVPSRAIFAGVAALLGGQSKVNRHLARSPFYYYEQAAPGIHRVFKSYDITGGMHTNGVMVTSTAYHGGDSKTYTAVLAARQAANDFIHANPRQAAEIYLALTGDKKAGVEQTAGWIADPDVVYTTAPIKVMDFADFMHKVGRIKRKTG